MRRKVVCGPPVEDMKYVRFFAHYIENTLHVLAATWGDGGLVSGPYLERLPRGLGIEALKFLSEGRPTVALAREENGYCRSVDRLRPLWVCVAGDARDAKDGNVVCFFQSAYKFKARQADVRLQRQGEL